MPFVVVAFAGTHGYLTGIVASFSISQADRCGTMAGMTSPRLAPIRGFPSLWRALILLACLCAAGCTTVGYYAQLGKGQAQLLLARRPIDQVLADPNTSPWLAQRLALAQRARRFAVDQLRLPDNRSYTYYVALPRPYVVWNVMATGKFSVDPVLHCFVIAGCVAYRGYFQLPLAKAEAARLQSAGDDVYVGGVPAYSTLGWFDDPILSSMLHWDDDELDGTIFHELAHQLIYVKNDSAFDESFATFVQQEGLQQWRHARGLSTSQGHDDAIDQGFTQLALDLRRRLKDRYAQVLDDGDKARAKQALIDDFRQRYRQWRDKNWPDDHRYDAWVAAPINNASLLPFGLYDQWTPAFAALFAASDRRWPVFYAQVRALAKQPRPLRDKALTAWLARSATLN